MSTIFTFQIKKLNEQFIIKGTDAKTLPYSIDFKFKKIVSKPKTSAKSLTLLTSMAFIAALLACNRVYQKLISKYEQKPTPSHPKNI